MPNEIMTVEEAIVLLKDKRMEINYKVNGTTRFSKALEMAIRALEVVQWMEEVFLQELPELDMREATEEERSSLKHYIDSISKSTGVKFNVNGVKTELEPCDDCISREAVLNKSWDVSYEGKYIQVVDVGDILDLSPVTPSYNSIKTELKSCVDCVKREDVKNEMIKYGFLAPDMTVTEFVEYLPSVKPQRPPGKWLDKKMTIKGAHGMAYGRYACSVCKKKFPNKSNYCPNCGAEMEVQYETDN